MPFDQSDGLRYYQFDIFSKEVLNAVFTRQGGISPEPWTSLNLSISVGDDPKRVAENRIHAFDALGRAPASIHDVWLVHGVDVIYADAPRPLDAPPENASGITSFFQPDKNLADLHGKLLAANVVTSLRTDRKGQHYLRLSPHFYNTDAELQRVLGLL